MSLDFLPVLVAFVLGGIVLIFLLNRLFRLDDKERRDSGGDGDGGYSDSGWGMESSCDSGGDGSCGGGD